MAANTQPIPPLDGALPYEVEPILCSDGYYAVDWTGVRVMMESFMRGVALNGKATSITTVRRTGLPDITRVETNWPAVRLWAANQVTMTLYRHRENLYRHSVSMKGFKSMLKGMLTSSQLAQAAYGQKLRQSHKATMLSVKQTVSRWETAIAITSAIEKLSAAALLVVGTAVTFGAGTPALVSSLPTLGSATVRAGTGAIAMGSMLKASAKYRETRNLDVATMEFGTNFIFSLIPAKNAKDAVMLVFADGTWETWKVLAEGKSIELALTAGLMKLTNFPIAKFLGTGDWNDYITKTVIGLTAKVLADATVGVGSDHLQGQAAEYFAKQLAAKRKAQRGVVAANNHAITDPDLFEKILNRTIVQLPSKSFLDGPNPFVTA